MQKELPKGWIETNLDTIVVQKKGKKPLRLEPVEFKNSVPYLDIHALEKGIYRQYAEKKSSNLMDENMIAIVWDGARSGWVSKGKFGAIGSTLAALKPINVDINYAFYFLQSKFSFINTNPRGIGIPHVDPTLLWNLRVPLPPLPEQHRIVAKLDTQFGHLDSLKTRLHRIPQLLKDFRQKVLIHAVTGKLTEEWRVGKELEEWTKENFGDLIIDTPKNGAYFHRSLYGTGTKIIRIDCFYDGKLKDWELVQRVQIDDKDKLIYEIKIGDILVNRVNSIEYLGKCLLVDNLPEECIFESNMMRIIVNKTLISPEYTKVFLISQNGLSELRKNAKHAVNQASINQQDVKAVEIDFPSLVEQQEIVRRVESLFAKADQIEASYQKLKTKIEQLPQALLAKAFRGELVKQLSTDGDARELLKQIKLAKAGLEKGGRTKKMKVEDELRMVAEDGVRYGK